MRALLAVQDEAEQNSKARISIGAICMFTLYAKLRASVKERLHGAWSRAWPLQA